MKKLLIVLMSTMFCLIIFAGCNKNNEDNNINNGGTNVNNEQTEIETISTLEGIWESEYRRSGENEKVVVENSTIKCFIRIDITHSYELRWAGIYIPLEESVSYGEWIFENDESCLEERPELSSKKFIYSNGKLSCNMLDANGRFRDVIFSKVDKQ